MPIPDDVSTANIDSETDDPRLWRADGLDLTQKFNELLAFLRNPTNAAGDGVTNDTAAFTALEEEFSGRVIDLLGKTYLVDAVPTGNVYVNGSFLVGSDAKAQGSDELVSWLTYHKSRGAWHVKAFGNSRSAVGSGNASVDTAALQAAFDNNEAVDITGADLLVNDEVVVSYDGARLGATIESHRNSALGARIRVVDPDMPHFLRVTANNFELSGFQICGDGTINQTIGVLFQKAAGASSDVDARIINMNFDYLGKAVHIYGRGLEMSGCTLANQQIAGVDIDWPADWTPKGPTTDLQTTGMRAYSFDNIRIHGNLGPAIRNIGDNALNCRGIVLNNIRGDIGSPLGIFEGVGINLIASGLQSNINGLSNATLVHLLPGSRSCHISNFTVGGYDDGTTTRLNWNGITLTTSAADPILDVVFSNGTIGPTARQGVLIRGDGDADNIVFQGVVWDRTGMSSGYFPIYVGTSVNRAQIKLSACGFRLTQANTPSYILGGKNSSSVQLRTDLLTTRIPFVPWAQENVNFIQAT